MKAKSIRYLTVSIAAVLCAVTLCSLLLIGLTGITLAAAEFEWRGAPDRAAAADITPEKNTTRKNASGVKIPSNAHSADFPGIYFIWDAKQKDNGYLKVSAGVFDEYESFILTTKTSNTYWDFKITPQAGQAKTDDNCYVFFIPKMNEKNINMVFIDTTVPKEDPPPETDSLVMTGEWIVSPNIITAVVENSTYSGVPGTVVEAGILYARDDITLSDPLKATAAAIGSPFDTSILGVSDGLWYYAAYVVNDAGDIFYGNVKQIAYYTA
ncbi:MAG TPA: hypothetical protein DEQ02_07430 [Ruminococcaceae bacterium]|nr:hypothetical protein [Oscillospiraceae bacterium]